MVLASGGGTTFQALVEASRAQDLAYEVVGLVCNQREAGALERAENLDLPGFYVDFDRKYPEEFFEDTLEIAQDLEADVIALAGFLLLVRNPLLKEFSGRILNTHPALLPLFGGKGMYGDFVHQAVVEARSKESGVTIHLVNDKYDEGQILGSVKVPVHAGENWEKLAERVRTEEKILYPRILNQFVTEKGFGC